MFMLSRMVKVKLPLMLLAKERARLRGRTVPGALGTVPLVLEVLKLAEHVAELVTNILMANGALPVGFAINLKVPIKTVSGVPKKSRILSMQLGAGVLLTNLLRKNRKAIAKVRLLTEAANLEASYLKEKEEKVIRRFV